MKVRQPVQHPRRHHLAGQAAGREVGRHGEWRDDQAVVGVRLPRHGADRGGDQDADEGGHGLQGQGYAVLPAAEPQPRQDHPPLFVQVLLLDADKIGLLDQEGVELGVGLLAPAPLAQADGHAGRRADGLGPAFGLAFRLFVPLSHGEHVSPRLHRWPKLGRGRQSASRARGAV